MALGTRAKFQIDILIKIMIFSIDKFQENVLGSSRNVSETTPGPRSGSEGNDDQHRRSAYGHKIGVGRRPLQ